TNIKIGLVDDLGRTLAFTSIPARAPDGPQQAIQRIADTCRELARSVGARPQDIPAAGLGTPGPMCLRRGMLLDPSHFPTWHYFPIRDALGDALGLPISFLNDANAAAYGEFWVGVGRDHDSLAMFTLGTGVGGGLIAEGLLINGTNSFGSECGHFVVDSRPDARLCVWGGGRGQLEAYASASAVAARAREAVEAGQTTSLREVLNKQGRLTAKDVYLAARDGDQFASDLIDDTAFFLGIGVVGAVHAIDPGLVVLGGAMNFGGSDCPIGRRFLNRVTEEFRQRTFPNVAEGTKIVFAVLGGSAGYIGAAGFARRAFHGRA
ncbi:MAG: ROK family protein, partial [Planctomycetota bacterium]